jgi:hypothetical protein
LNATHPWPKTPEQELVELTQAHIEFPCSYTFPSYQKILIDELVLPNKKVLDYLTQITAAKAEDLEGVSLTQEAVQVCCQPQFMIF